MTDTCELREIKIRCRVGIDGWESDIPQTLVVNLRFPVDVAVAAQADDIAKTVDYRAVADGLFKTYEGQRFHLVERVAESIAMWVLEHTPVAWVEVNVTKDISKTAAKTATIAIRRERT